MRRIQIYDTTLRDGSQGEGVSFSLHDKIAIARKLDDLGFDYIEGGYPLSNEKDVEFFAALRNDPLRNARATAFGMTRRRDADAASDPGMQALVAAESPAVTIVGKTSEFHVTDVLRVSLEENLAMISESVGFVHNSGREVIYDAEHFFDGWKLNPEYAAKTIKAAAEAGASIIVLCDTNGGSMPEEIAELTRAAEKAVGIPIGIHCHNDCEVAVANTLAAVDAGAVQVQGTINGIGERCGNADLISVIANLALKKHGYEVLSPAAVERLTELSRYVYETANMHYRNGQPFVGPSAFAHKGGMHVHAVNRAASSYEHVPPESVGNERRILVSELSGRSNIISKMTQDEMKNDRVLMDSILAKVVSMENEGYQFEAAEASFDLLVQKCAKTYEAQFERIKYHVEVACDPDGEHVTEATVKLRVGDEIRHEVGEGDGPVNALDAALRKALAETYPHLAEMQLVDYRVRVVNSEAGTAARIRVTIESKDDHAVWGTVGVSENIIEASWIALVDAIEYKLLKDNAASPVGAST
ncbi:MAG: citramalate synthase [Planctomycetales bacterium]|nr:citramalate synthase [Planctomycetales bacterium]